MNLKVLVCVCVALLMCVACNDKDVDSSYLFSAEELVVTVTGKDGLTLNRNEILLDSLKKNEFIGDFHFLGESRAENDKFASEKFKEKCKSLQKLDIHSMLNLQSGELGSISFVYVLSRDKAELAREIIRLEQAIVPVAQ